MFILRVLMVGFEMSVWMNIGLKICIMLDRWLIIGEMIIMSSDFI